VVSWLGVLTAVGFDNQPRLDTGEIDDVWRDGILAAEAPAELSLTEHAPERAFCVGGGGAKLAGAGNDFLSSTHIRTIGHQKPPP
jgi:hypothetical protein